MDDDAVRTAAEALFDAAGEMKWLSYQGYQRASATAEDLRPVAWWWLSQHRDGHRGQAAFSRGLSLLVDHGVLETHAPEHIPGIDRLDFTSIGDVAAPMKTCADTLEAAVSALGAALTTTTV